jgi:lipopolysaccharide/colanic/teichoic acid biosynthesis glycosyltransferase
MWAWARLAELPRLQHSVAPRDRATRCCAIGSFPGGGYSIHPIPDVTNPGSDGGSQRGFDVVGRAGFLAEAALAERSDRAFSVVVFDLRRLRRAPDAMARLLLALLHAVGPTDQLGFLDRHRLSLALPLTAPAEAIARGERVARASARHCRRPPFAVYADARASTACAAVAGARAVRPVAGLLYTPLPRWKRLVDILGATIGLVLAAPLLAVAAVLVRGTSSGPALFRQRRAGLYGASFTCYKLRTMVADAEVRKRDLMAFNERHGPTFKMTKDPRVTWIGRFLRVTSIDELPQLWNVLRGDMSLVGPRPPTLDEVPAYQPWQLRRLSVPPGLTCIWQVKSRGSPDFDNWVRLDLHYVRRRSPLFDFFLLAATVPAVLMRRGAH